MKNQTTQSIIVSVLIIFTVITGFNFFVKSINAEAPREYKYLEKLPDASGNPQETFVFNDDSINNYINTLIRLAIGIGGVLAVVRIVMGGIEYMGNEVISNKESGKEKIYNAILGLILVLSAYVILNTINSQLISGAPKIEKAKVAVTLDQTNFSKTEGVSSSVGTKYVDSGKSSGVDNFLKNNNKLSGVTVDTSKKLAVFCNGSSCLSVPINIGYNGVSQPGTGAPGDSKTPLGTTTLSGDRRIGNNGNAVISVNGYNLGSAFINLGIKDSNGNDRGIGFHGSYNDNLGTTNGCIRMKNGDLLALAPLMSSGLKIDIK